MARSPHHAHRRKSSSTHGHAPPSPTAANPPLKRPRLSSALSLDSTHAVVGNEEHVMQGLRIEGPADEGSTTKRHDDGESAAWTPTLTKAQRAKQKKQDKLLQKVDDGPAEFHFNTSGFKHERTIKLTDVRDLVLHIHAEEKASNWMVLRHKQNIARTVVVMIPGITTDSLGLSPSGTPSHLPFSCAGDTSKLPIMQSLFSHGCPTKANGDRYKMHSCTTTFLTCPMSTHAKKSRDDARKRLTVSLMAKDPTTYLLSSEIMLEQGYPPTTYPTAATAISRQAARNIDPQPSTSFTKVDFSAWKQPDGWIQTPRPSTSVLGRELKVLGVDCEMCKTRLGSELTRVSIVNDKGKVVYDTLVKPEEPILDYVTRFSGMTEERLVNVTTRLNDVQRQLSDLIDFDTVLVGHSLECDLRVLKLAHPWVIDTSVIFHHPKGLPYKPSLKWLARKWLNKEIQTTSTGTDVVVGHDSEEDARTTIDLLEKKLEKGPGFGEFSNDMESIFERMSKQQPPGCQCAVIDSSSAFQPGFALKANTLVSATTDEEVIRGILSTVSTHQFVFARLMDLSHALEWSTPSWLRSNQTLEDNSVPTETRSVLDLPSTYTKLNTLLETLHESLPKRTALIVFTGHSDPREMSRLNVKKAKFDRLYKSSQVLISQMSEEDKWMAEDERSLVDAVEKCKSGLSFYRVRN